MYFQKLNLPDLKLLNMSHNKIGHMEMNIFKNLQEIRVIDISYNVIQYIMAQWFVELPKLKELYLNNNDLSTFSSEQYLISNSLQVIEFIGL